MVSKFVLGFPELLPGVCELLKFLLGIPGLLLWTSSSF